MRNSLRQPAIRLFALGVLLSTWLAGGAAEPGLRAGAARGEKSGDPKTFAPPFSIQKLDDAWWLVSPEGKPFFSRGVCCVIPGASREKYDPENPEYAAWKYYPNHADWADATAKRLRAWGFTTAGGWSDYTMLRQSSAMTLGLTPVLHIGSTAGAPWWDMWDPAIVHRMDDTARPQILAVRDDPRLIGYYSDNELGWWNATLFKMTLEQSASSGQRKRLIQLLRKHYGNDWSRLVSDFEPENAAGWAGLERRGMLFLRPGGQGIQVMRQFLRLLAGRYYQLVHDIIRKYDRRALILGDRFQSFYYPEVARACAPYVDAVSSNLNAHWNDGSWARFYLDTLHALTGKPVIVTEYYMAATQNRSGNQNDQGIFPVVPTQAERAEAARRTLTDLLRLPYVIGADWFQYFDEPTHGRNDGENFNFGLVDIHDQPYEELAGAWTSVDANRLKAQSPAKRPDARNGVPPAPKEPLGQFAPTTALKHWDRERGWVPPSSEFPLADLYLCWAPQGLYLGLYSLDIIEDAYYRDHSLPKSDRPLWVTQVNGRDPIRARIGAGREPLVNDPGVKVLNLSGLNLNVRNLAILEIPAQRLGKERLQAGETVDLNVTLATHCQAYQVTWKGQFTLAD